MRPWLAHHGMVAMAIRTPTPSTMAIRPDVVCRRTRTEAGRVCTASLIVSFPSQDPLWANSKHDQEHDVADQDSEARIETESERLADPEHHGADESPPN